MIKMTSCRLLALSFIILAACSDGNMDNDTAPFVEIAEELGINFTHKSGVDDEFHMTAEMGAGSALFDADNDGDLDLYLLNTGRGKGGDLAANRFYRQEGNGTFADVTTASGLGDTGIGMGAVVGDIDNDGDLDVFVTNLGPDALYRNDGNGVFTNVTGSHGITSSGWSASAAFFDADVDGDLDLYVTSYVVYDSTKVCTDRAGRRHFCGPKNFQGAADVFYRNEGDGTFTDQSVAAGISDTWLRGLGVVSLDANDDGLPDLYVANDTHPNNLWLNQGDETFEDVAVAWGCAYNQQGQVEGGMGIAVGDFDRNHRDDLFVTHFANESNTVYFAEQVGFRDGSRKSGFESLAMRKLTAFGTAAHDFDHDGILDLIIANGKVDRADGERESTDDFWAPYHEPNLFVAGQEEGRFVATDVGSFSKTIETSRGLSTGDIDGDGDIDFVVNNCDGLARVYRNDMVKRGSWLALRLKNAGRTAIGAKAQVHAEGKQWIAEVRAGSSYLSHSDTALHFGLGQVQEVDSVVVVWPGGERNSYDDVQLNALSVLKQR